MTSQNPGAPKETSFFDSRTLESLYDEIRDIYRRYPQPLVIGYSGGKDSTTILQLVWKALEKLPLEERQKTVYVVASDTKVETPVIVDYIDGTLNRIKVAAESNGMPFKVQKVTPTINDSFWVNLIGRGYPAPTTRFRWCTDRLKINPVNRFIQEKVTQHGEVIMVLGTRKSESATRMQLMSTYQVKGHLLRHHSTLPGAYVYAPIADFSTDDVWTYLLQVPSPWGNNNRDLAALYRSANAGECPLVIDTTTPSCGNSRFGCWVCTVAKRDTSMEAMIDHGEEWMEPLLEFREWLNTTTDPDRKREFRDIRGRDGRVVLKRDGTPAARTYKLDISKQMLKQVLLAQKKIRSQGPDSSMTLIGGSELHLIRHIWRTEREDWEDSVPQIFHEVNGFDLDWLHDDDLLLDASHKVLLSNVCEEYGVPFSMIAKMLEVEKRRDIATQRSGTLKELETILHQEWRSEDEILSEHHQFSLLEQ
jgi:DNA sulfur modification protein DndC